MEAIRCFGNARKTGFPKTTDIPDVFTVCNGFSRKLRKAGHVEKFYNGNDECWEIQLGDSSLKSDGIDDQWADDVDIFIICTHGNHSKENKPLVLFNTQKNDFLGLGKFWKFGNKKLKWLFLKSCLGINLKNVMACIDIFDNLHGICGAYDLSYTYPESGEDLGEYLTDEDYTVADAWLEAQTGGWGQEDSHPIVVCANDEMHYDGKGNLLKNLSTLNRDKLRPNGFRVHDIPRSDIVGLHWQWVE
jgi:hypothetical protein